MIKVKCKSIQRTPVGRKTNAAMAGANRWRRSSTTANIHCNTLSIELILWARFEQLFATTMADNEDDLVDYDEDEVR